MTELRDIPTARLVGLMALSFSTLYLLSDAIEAIQGGFSDAQWWLSLVASLPGPHAVSGRRVAAYPY
jgi:hypothetical protein